MNIVWAAFLAVFLWLGSFGGVVYASVIATADDIVNGKKNLADPAFLAAGETESGLGAAVRSLLTGSMPMSGNARMAVLRSVIEATEKLPRARGGLDDVSSRLLYESLLTYDMMLDKSVFSEPELLSMKNSFRLIIEHYNNPDNFAWEDDRWCLGAGALRIVASEAMYSFLFPEDADTDRIRLHTLRYLQKNLTESVDQYGAWKPDPPVCLDEAVEYIVVAAKAFANAGIYDVFADPSFKRLLLWGIKVLPPQNSESLRGKFTIPSIGSTPPDGAPAGSFALAASGIRAGDPRAASEIMWYWNVCGRPVSTLGALFIDTTIEPSEPEMHSTVAGKGSVVMRDDSVSPDESYLFTGFGPSRGRVNLNDGDHSDSGDFSYIWRGNPMIIHDGTGDDTATETLMNRTGWRHSIVLYDGAGETPEIKESELAAGEARRDVMGHATPPSDFYEDNVNQFFTSRSLDYVCGEVRLAPSDLPAASYYRHFLMLKPDALLVWDQIESSYPLEWNLWVPAENIWTDKNVLHLSTSEGIDLQAHFIGESAVNVTTETYPQGKNWDWPIIMRTEYGGGFITLICADVFGRALADSSGLSQALLQNAVSFSGKPARIGLITVNAAIPRILKTLGIDSETLTYETARNIDFSRYSTLIIGSDTTAEQDRVLLDFGDKINNYIGAGGSAVVISRKNLPWLTCSSNPQGAFPVPVSVGECVVTAETAAKGLMLADDPFFNEPNPITLDTWSTLLPNAEAGTVIGTPPIALTLPASWSDSWKVLASVSAAYPMKPFESTVFGRPTHIRIKHPASRDFMTLFLPRKTGDPTYLFDVKRMERGFVTIADPTTTWEIKAGPAAWTDANLSVLIDSVGVRQMYAFDCTLLRIAKGTIQSDAPMSIYYSESEDSGVIMTTTNNRIVSARHEIRPHAGEFRFSNLFGSISLERLAYITVLSVKDAEGRVISGASVYGSEGFIGTTDENGSHVVRWNGAPPSVRIVWRGKETALPLVPGKLDVVMPQ